MSSYVVKTSKWRGPPPALPSLDIELTERCQNNCLHCCINLPVDDPCVQRELSTEKLKGILQEATNLGCLLVRFTGGEPLLRKDFEEIYMHARHLGMRVMLFTNARLITPHLADILAQVPPLQFVEVSVYGMTEKSYDASVRSSGAFVEFRRGIDLLLARRVPFVVKWVVLPPNSEELEKFKTWAATLPWRDPPPGINSTFQLRSRRDSPEKNRLIQELRLRSQSPEVSETLKEFCRKFLGPQGDILFSCGVGEKPCVDAYGRLQPCIGLRAPELSYDLHSGSLRHALKQVFPKLKEIRATEPEYLRRCARCFLKNLCEQCPGRSWSESGNFETPVEYLCRIAHTTAQFLGLLCDGERGWLVQDWKKRIDKLNCL